MEGIRNLTIRENATPMISLRSSGHAGIAQSVNRETHNLAVPSWVRMQITANGHRRVQSQQLRDRLARFSLLA